MWSFEAYVFNDMIYERTIETNWTNNFEWIIFQIVDVSKATAQMYGTKVEIILPKAEPGHWNNLDFPRAAPAKVAPADEEKNVPAPVPDPSGNDSDVDLEEIEPLRAVKITEA